MTTSYDVYRAARQCGVVEAHDIGDAVDIAVSYWRADLRGRNVAVMSGSRRLLRLLGCRG